MEDFSGPGVSMGCHAGGMELSTDGALLVALLQIGRCDNLSSFSGCGALCSDGVALWVMGWSNSGSVGRLDTGYQGGRDGSVSRRQKVAWQVGQLSRVAWV